MQVQTNPQTFPVKRAQFHPEATRLQKMTLPVGTILGIDIDDHHTHPQCNFNMVRELVEDGIAIAAPNGALTLTQPWTGSVSSSAVMVKGKGQNGWTYWTVDEPGTPFHGQLIDEVRNQ